MAWQTRDLVIASGVSVAAAAGFPSSGLNCEIDLRYSMEVAFTYATGTNGAGNVKVQISNDGVAWADRSGSTAAYTSGTSMVMFEVIDKAHRYCRLAFADVSGSGGTAVVKFHGEYDTE